MAQQTPADKQKLTEIDSFLSKSQTALTKLDNTALYSELWDDIEALRLKIRKKGRL